MRNDTCPICRKQLEGRSVTTKILSKIRKKKKEDKNEREEIDISDYFSHFIVDLDDVSSEYDYSGDIIDFLFGDDHSSDEM